MHDVEEIEDLVKEYARLEIQMLNTKQRQIQILSDIEKIATEDK